MRPKHFYSRSKLRLADLRSVRAEMCSAYRAAVRQELSWDDFKAATLGLFRIAQLDQGQLIEQRVAELEQQGVIAAKPPNGEAHTWQ